MIEEALGFVGARLLGIAQALGEVTALLRSSLTWSVRSRLEARQTLIQMVRIGVESLPVATLTSFFTGMVLALQSGTTSKDLFNEPLYVGTLVGFSMVKELGPVLTAFVVAGRAAAAITAEIGTMKVTEQIDALYTLGTNPVRYLVIPRYIAMLVVLPLLTVFADFTGTFGGFVVSVTKLSIPSSVYWDDILTFMKNKHFFHGFIKTFFFAIAITTVCCYKGLNTRGGAEGVGRSTTAAVVASMVSILVIDYFVTAILVVLGIG